MSSVRVIERAQHSSHNAGYNYDEVPESLFLPRDAEAVDATVAQHKVTRKHAIWLRLRDNKTAIASAVVLLVIIAVAFLSPVFLSTDPNAQHVPQANLPPKWPGVTINGLNGYSKFGGVWTDAYAQAQAGDTYYLLGSDQLGRDLFARLLYGTRISLIISFVAGFLDIAIGVIWGLTSGLAPRHVDDLMQRVLEIISGVPSLIVVVLMLLIFEPGLVSIITAMAMTFWISMARVVRGQTACVAQYR